MQPPGSQDFLLAFLALTARFHPLLVAHFSPSRPNHQSDPLVASEYFASAAAARIAGHQRENPAAFDLEQIQALLMMTLHEWTVCRGTKAWIYLGTAIRSAQLVGLQYEQDLDHGPLSHPGAINLDTEELGLVRSSTSESRLSQASSDEGSFRQQEIRRRTFWSCFILDRCLSSGKYRPQSFHVDDIQTQLPASERAFLFGDRVGTLLLGQQVKGVSEAGQENYDPHGRQETGVDEGLLSRYVKVMEIYGRVVRWSCNGGRRFVPQY